MTSPTTSRFTVRRRRSRFADKRYVTIGAGRAGSTPQNPILLGIGIRWVIITAAGTTSVSAYLSRAVSENQTTSRTAVALTQTGDNAWEASGAAGGALLGFPQNPQPDYSTPQCYKLEVVARRGSRTTTSVYYFWVGTGSSGTIVSPSDRQMQGVTLFGGSVEVQHPDEPITWEPLRSHVLTYPDGFFDPVGAGVVDATGNAELFPAGSYAVDNVPPEGSTRDQGLFEVGPTSPFDDIADVLVQPVGPTLLGSGLDDSVPVLGNQDFASLFIIGYDGHDIVKLGYAIDLLPFYQYTPLNGGLVVAPTETAMVMADVYANGPSQLTTPNGYNNGVAIDGGGTFKLDSTSDEASLSGTHSFTLTRPSEVAWFSGTVRYFILVGDQATWDGGAFNGTQLDRKAAGSPEQVLVVPCNDVYYPSGGTWSNGVMVIGDTVQNGTGNPIAITTPALAAIAGFGVGDDICYQVVAWLGTDNPSFGTGGGVFSLELPYNVWLSNVYKCKVVA